MPLVSVIIPCYRQARFLPQSVQSVLEQTVQDVEAIIVDDGSPESCREHVADLLRDPRVRLIRQEHLGLPQARNTGIQGSASRYLAFLDADDWLAPEFCARLEEALAAGPRCAFAYCDIQEVFDRDVAPPQNQPPYSVGASRLVTSGDIFPSLLMGGYFPPASVVVSRAVLEEVGLFDVELGGHADWDLWLRIAAAYPACYVDEKLAYYRRHSQAMSLDHQHMGASRLRTLQKLLRGFPDRVAGAMNDVMRTAEEQFKTNQALQKQLQFMESEQARLRREAAAYFEESQNWIASLEKGKNWHEEQADNWKSRFEALQNWIASQEETSKG